MKFAYIYIHWMIAHILHSQGTQDLVWRSYVLSWMKNLPKDVCDAALQL